MSLLVLRSGARPSGSLITFGSSYWKDNLPVTALASGIIAMVNK